MWILRYFDIEIDPSLPRWSDADANHQFHEALLQELFKRDSPLYGTLGKDSNLEFLRDFKKLRNHHKAGKLYSHSTQSAISKLDFQSRWHNLASTLCAVVKAIKMEAVQRSNRKTAWRCIRAYEFRIQLRLSLLNSADDEEGRNTKIVQRREALQVQAEMLCSFAEDPRTSLQILKTHKHQLTDWERRDKIYEARASIITKMTKEKVEAMKVLEEKENILTMLQEKYDALMKANEDKFKVSKQQTEERLEQARENSHLRLEVARLEARVTMLVKASNAWTYLIPQLLSRALREPMQMICDQVGSCKRGIWSTTKTIHEEDGLSMTEASSHGGGFLG